MRIYGFKPAIRAMGRMAPGCCTRPLISPDSHRNTSAAHSRRFTLGYGKMTPGNSCARSPGTLRTRISRLRRRTLPTKVQPLIHDLCSITEILMKSTALSLALTAMVLTAAADETAVGPQPVRTIFERHDQTGVPGKEIVIGSAMLPAGTTIGYHAHPGDESGYVLKG